MSKIRLLVLVLCLGLAGFLTLSTRLEARHPHGVFLRENIWEQNITNEFRPQRFQQRRQRMLSTCHTMGNKEDVEYTLRNRMLYFWGYNASICVMGKVGSSTWRTHIQRINGLGEIRAPMDPRRLDLLEKPWEKVIDFTNSLSKWITVRHPLARLVSCFQNKYHDGKVMRYKNNLIEFLFPALLSNGFVYKNQRQDLWLKFLKKSNVIQTFLQPKDKRLRESITFTQFLFHVVKTFETQSTNRHWMTYGTLCSPCFFKYDYITRLETQAQDLEYLFQTFALPTDPEMRKNSLGDVTGKLNEDLRYYQSVPEELKRKIYNIYQVDMEMFGYELPEDFWQTARVQI